MIFNLDVVMWLFFALVIVALGGVLWWVTYKQSDDIRRRGLGIAPTPPPASAAAQVPAPPPVPQTGPPVPYVPAPPPAPPAGWYPVEGGQRYWDGRQWTTPVVGRHQ